MNLRARTIRPDGTIANFDGKIFDKSIAKAKGLKYLAKTLTLPDVQVGSVIVYFYTLDLSEHYVYDSHWILSNELFTKERQFLIEAIQEPIQQSAPALDLAGIACRNSAA